MLNIPNKKGFHATQNKYCIVQNIKNMLEKIKCVQMSFFNIIRPWKYFDKYIEIIEKRIKQNRVITFWDSTIHNIHELRSNDDFMEKIDKLLDEFE